MEHLADSDLISMSVVFNGRVRLALAHDAGLNIAQYRVLTLSNAREGGATARAAAQALHMKKSLFSQVTKSLVDAGLATVDVSGAEKACVCTPAGHEVLTVADGAVALEHEELFGCLGDEIRGNLLAGSVVTSVFFDVARMDEGKFMAEFANLDGSLRAELFYKRIAQNAGLSLAALRVLLALAERGGSLGQSEIGWFLALGKPKVSAACQDLQARGLVERRPGPLDKRNVVVSCTLAGDELTSALIDAIASEADGSIRPVAQGEVGFYLEVAKAVMDALRSSR